MPLDRLAQQGLESALVWIVFENSLSLIAPANHVIKRTGIMNARSAGHGPDLSPNNHNKQINNA